MVARQVFKETLDLTDSITLDLLPLRIILTCRLKMTLMVSLLRIS